MPWCQDPTVTGHAVPSIRRENEGAGCLHLRSKLRSFTSDKASGWAQENKPVAEPLACHAWAAARSLDR